VRRRLTGAVVALGAALVVAPTAAAVDDINTTGCAMA
jgi:hypothetical protein